MAKAGAKKRLEENKTHLRRLLIAILIGIAAYVIGRLYIFRSAATWWNYMVLTAVILVQFVCYGSLASCARPTYDEKGDLSDGGMDLFQSGMMSYTHDVIYISILLQFLGIAYDWIWLIFLAVPVMISYQLWDKVVSPYIFTPREGEAGYNGNAKETAVERKRREKLERKQNRPKMKMVR
eukprot:CAMPEP_0114285490 /NCGR_PEP_ID=MMETSP0059-20121206/5213_1 /TAXON_ID=36894 /ORGANISM="Pyramimonas parkeae, Strain CCMP726" /LENGTH=179 /DNA_ID=CAMNT_0001406389 /DNA_START=55 /DNA_END=594 /DNA_ORIENTATION=+